MYSEEFDERDLIGKWETIDSIGSFRSNLKSPLPIENFNYLELYEFRRNGDDSCGVIRCTVYENVKHWNEDGSVSEGWEYVHHYGHVNMWFISNSNKLHIQCQARADFKYVIKSLDSEYLVLETYDGKGRLILKRKTEEVDDTYVDDRFVDTQEEDTYTLNGVKIKGMKSKGIYVTLGKTIIATNGKQ